jgi:hypothetical protein
MLRWALNLLFPSAYFYPDGSRIDYLIRDDCLRYITKTPVRRMVEIPLKYDAITKRSRIDRTMIWRWKDSDAALSADEISELTSKIRTFIARRPSEFEPV